MKKLEHPKDIFVQLSDEAESESFAFAFTDNFESGESLDPNSFDNETLERLEKLFSTAFMLIHNKKEHGKEIPKL